MTTDWEYHLDRHLDQWTAAGLLDPATATRIRAWDKVRSRPRGLTWPVWIALAFGAILLAAGVLLFVSAHWDDLSRAGRLSMLAATIAVLHASGAVAARRFEGLGVALHAVASVSLGAAIALAAQVLNLNQHWPTVVLLWAIGCALAWLLLKHWTQAALCAVLFPWWLASEWDAPFLAANSRVLLPVWVGVCALSFVYLSARRSSTDSPFRKALGWLGGLALLPAASTLVFYGLWARRGVAGGSSAWIAWALALLVPFAVALALDTRRALWNTAAIVWTLVLGVIGSGPRDFLAAYCWCAVGAVLLAAWGIRDARAERVNLAVAGLAITVIAFYFSNIMDKLGRSASLIAMGLLFLGGGWVLEQTRRRLLAHAGKNTL